MQIGSFYKKKVKGHYVFLAAILVNGLESLNIFLFRRTHGPKY